MSHQNPDAALAEPPTDPIGAPSARQASPPAPGAPGWLKLIFPALGDLSENPLYIRLSGRGFGKRGLLRRLGGPREFRAGASSWLILTRLGLWPVIMFFVPWTLAGAITGFGHRSPPFFGIINQRMRESGMMVLVACSLWIFLFLGTRMIWGRPRHGVIHFFRRARLEGWGDDLLLSGLTARDVKRAIFAAAVPRLAATIFAHGGVWAAVILWNAPPSEHWVLPATLSYWIATWIFFSGLETCDVAHELARASLGADPEPPPRRVVAEFLTSGLTVFVMMLPALFAHWVLNAFFVPDSTPTETAMIVNFIIGYLNIIMTCFFFSRWIDRRVLAKF